jgi:hypothetical protein
MIGASAFAGLRPARLHGASLGDGLSSGRSPAHLTR